MTINFDIFSILTLALIFQGLFASIILLVKRENKAANRFLATLSLLISLWLCDTFFRVSGIYSQKPDFYFLPIYFSFGFGPLIYFYTRFLTKESERLTPLAYLHFIPVVFQGVFYVYLRFKNYTYRRDFWIEIHEPFTYDLELALSCVSLSVYLILSRRLIVSYKNRIENSFSSTQEIALKWLDRLHLIFFAVSFFWLIETVSRTVWGEYAITPFSSITMGIIVVLIAVGALLQSDLTDIKQEAEAEDSKDKLKGTLSAGDQEKLTQIEKIMTDQRLYLKPELSLKEFAQYVGLPSRETSRLINQGLHVSFIDFVNQYRIDCFKSMATNVSNQHLSLLGLAFESGFNSKSTFNRVFKKMEGMSPSSFVNAS